MPNALNQGFCRFCRFDIQFLGKLLAKRFIMSDGRSVVSTDAHDLYQLPVRRFIEIVEDLGSAGCRFCGNMVSLSHVMRGELVEIVQR